MLVRGSLTLEYESLFSLSLGCEKALVLATWWVCHKQHFPPLFAVLLVRTMGYSRCRLIGPGVRHGPERDRRGREGRCRKSTYQQSVSPRCWKAAVDPTRESGEKSLPSQAGPHTYGHRVLILQLRYLIEVSARLHLPLSARSINYQEQDKLEIIASCTCEKREKCIF